MNQLRGACIIGQSGGPTSVINASALGVIETALKSDAITQVLGAEHGIKGVLNDRLFDMGLEDPQELALPKWTTPITSVFWRYLKSTMSVTSSTTAAMIPWILAARSANTCNLSVMSVG